MCAVALSDPVGRRPSAGGVPGAKRAPYPGFLEPCDPTLRDRAPDGFGWLHEIKIDGYRAQVHIHHGRVSVYSRSGYDWTEQFGQIARAVEALSADELIIDGEATVLGNTGRPDFQALRRELARKNSDRLVYKPAANEVLQRWPEGPKPTRYAIRTDARLPLWLNRYNGPQAACSQTPFCTSQLVRLRKERTRQWGIVPAHAPAGIGDHVQRSMGRRKGVIEELALTRQQLGPSVEERARHNDDARPRAFHPDGARGRRNVLFLLDLRDLERGVR
jgi:ATP dependent DNA ligase domain